MRYKKQDGTEFALGSHTPKEWGAVVFNKLRALGCDVIYCNRVARAYEEAKPV